MKDFEIKADGLGPLVELPDHDDSPFDFSIIMSYHIYNQDYWYYKGFNLGINVDYNKSDIKHDYELLIKYIDLLNSELFCEIKGLNDVIKFRNNPENFTKVFMKPTDKIYEVKI